MLARTHPLQPSIKVQASDQRDNIEMHWSHTFALTNEEAMEEGAGAVSTLSQQDETSLLERLFDAVTLLSNVGGR